MSSDLERMQTARLICERLVPAHAAELTLLLGDPRVAQTMFADGKPLTRARIAQRIPAKARHWDEHGFGPWLVRDRRTLAMVGRGGLQHTWVAGRDQVEVGWAIVPDRWGEGLATELAQLSVRTGFDDLGLKRIVAFTLPDNLASRRVMEKSGFAYERDIVHSGLPHVFYHQEA